MTKKKREQEEEAPEYSFLTLDHDAEPIRCVRPYVFNFTSFAKGRWLGRPLIDILTKEFGGYTESYWYDAIATERVVVNKKKVTPEYIVQNGDHILHRTHRHEPPVRGRITLVGETDDLMAVCKPSSMPMHPCGGYRYNSLSFILAHEPLISNQPELSAVHRLDRVTSGLVIIAKNKKKAALVSKEIRENSTRKTYLARVKGKFASSLTHLTALDGAQLFAPTESEEIALAMKHGADFTKKRKRDANYNSNKVTDSCDDEKLIKEDSGDAIKESIGYGWQKFNDAETNMMTIDETCFDVLTHELVVRCPLGVASFREGIHTCDIDGKPALSAFRFISYNEEDDTSVVYCKPHTGRTHQLRLHLQLIGNPIANDPCYGGELFFGEPEKMLLAKAALERLRQRGGRTLSKLPHLLHILPASEDSDLERDKEGVKDSGDADEKKDSDILVRGSNETEEEFLVRNCRYCQEQTSPNMTDEMVLHCDGIWLHALKYCGKEWEFETPFPAWASKKKL